MNANLVREKIREKFGSQVAFSKASGIAPTILSRMLSGERVPKAHEIKLMAMLLEVPESDIKNAPKASAKVVTSDTPSASSLIEMDALKGQITSLQDELRALRNDLSMMAKMLIEINKTGHETKAQTSLNAEELTAIFSKVGEINGNVTKLYAVKKKGY